MVLFINACIGANSRTERIARAFPGAMGAEELRLDQIYLEPADEGILARRAQRIANGDFSHSYFQLAKKFAEAEEIVIAAPFWDLSFPSKLRIYLENVCIPGLTFRYSPEGKPVGMCRARKLTFITTAGGPYMPQFSYDYIKALATYFFGIPETALIYAENLDVTGNNPDRIIEECIQEYCN